MGAQGKRQDEGNGRAARALFTALASSFSCVRMMSTGRLVHAAFFKKIQDRKNGEKNDDHHHANPTRTHGKPLLSIKAASYKAR